MIDRWLVTCQLARKLSEGAGGIDQLDVMVFIIDVLV